MASMFENLRSEAEHMPAWRRHKFLILIAMAIVIACVLVTISMKLYESSGTAQLDLSRPGYKSVRDQVHDKKDLATFPSNGEIDSQVLKEFDELLTKQRESLEKVVGFGSNALENSTLGLPTFDD